MKKKSLVLTLAITLVVGLGATAYAATAPTNANGQGAGVGLGRLTGFRGFDIISNILKGKGVTDEEITNGINSGKTIGTLAEEKGITSEELKKSMLNEKIKVIDDAVAKGTLTNEQGDIAKARITENNANCTTPGQMSDRMGGQNRGREMHGIGMQGKGMQGGSCLNTNLAQ